MAYKIPAHLHRNRHGMLYFRLAVPPDLRDAFGQAEVYRSLRTAKLSEAKMAAQALAISYRQCFAKLRDPTMANLKKPAASDIIFEYKFEVSLDEMGKPSGIMIEAEPHEQDAVNSHLAPILAAPNATKVGTRPAVTFRELATDYIRTKQPLGKWKEKTESENLEVAPCSCRGHSACIHDQRERSSDRCIGFLATRSPAAFPNFPQYWRHRRGQKPLLRSGYV